MRTIQSQVGTVILSLEAGRLYAEWMAGGGVEPRTPERTTGLRVRLGFVWLLLITPDAASLVGRWRAEHDYAARFGIPAHVTVRTPIPSPERWRDPGFSRLERFLPTDVTLARLENRPGGLVIVAEPDDGLREITAAVGLSWPSLPPHKGNRPDLAYHMTVARTTNDRIRSQASEAIRPHLPLRVTGTEDAGVEGSSQQRPAAYRRHTHAASSIRPTPVASLLPRHSPGRVSVETVSTGSLVAIRVWLGPRAVPTPGGRTGGGGGGGGGGGWWRRRWRRRWCEWWLVAAWWALVALVAALVAAALVAAALVAALVALVVVAWLVAWWWRRVGGGVGGVGGGGGGGGVVVAAVVVAAALVERGW